MYIANSYCLGATSCKTNASTVTSRVYDTSTYEEDWDVSSICHLFSYTVTATLTNEVQM